MTQSEMKKAINREAKKYGFIMRKQNATLNGKRLFSFENRESGRVLVSNMIIDRAYDTAMHVELFVNDKSSWINK